MTLLGTALVYVAGHSAPFAHVVEVLLVHVSAIVALPHALTSLVGIRVNVAQLFCIIEVQIVVVELVIVKHIPVGTV